MSLDHVRPSPSATTTAVGPAAFHPFAPEDLFTLQDQAIRPNFQTPVNIFSKTLAIAFMLTTHLSETGSRQLHERERAMVRRTPKAKRSRNVWMPLTPPLIRRIPNRPVPGNHADLRGGIDRPLSPDRPVLSVPTLTISPILRISLETAERITV